MVIFLHFRTGDCAINTIYIPIYFVIDLSENTQKDLGIWVSEQKKSKLEISLFRCGKLQELADRNSTDSFSVN